MTSHDGITTQDVFYALRTMDDVLDLLRKVQSEEEAAVVGINYRDKKTTAFQQYAAEIKAMLKYDPDRLKQIIRVHPNYFFIRILHLLERCKKSFCPVVNYDDVRHSFRSFHLVCLPPLLPSIQNMFRSGIFMELTCEYSFNIHESRLLSEHEQYTNGLVSLVKSCPSLTYLTICLPNQPNNPRFSSYKNNTPDFLRLVIPGIIEALNEQAYLQGKVNLERLCYKMKDFHIVQVVMQTIANALITNSNDATNNNSSNTPIRPALVRRHTALVLDFDIDFDPERGEFLIPGDDDLQRFDDVQLPLMEALRQDVYWTFEQAKFVHQSINHDFTIFGLRTIFRRNKIKNKILGYKAGGKDVTFNSMVNELGYMLNRFFPDARDRATIAFLLMRRLPEVFFPTIQATEHGPHPRANAWNGEIDVLGLLLLCCHYYLVYRNFTFFFE